MRCLYINLAAQTDRRAFLERNFATHAPSEWQLQPISAVEPQYVHSHAVSGKLRDSEKACLLSHTAAIAESMQCDGHVMIVEDDVLFGPSSCLVIEEALQILGDTAWDILFTDVCIPSTHSMIDLFELRRSLLANSQLNLLPLQHYIFAGSTAYIVHESAKEKILTMLRAVAQFDLPYDLLLRQWIHDARLKGYVIYPFATSLSSHAESSQIQPGETEATDAAWNAFRRLVWFDAEQCPEDPVRSIGRIDPSYYDPMTTDFAQILRVMLAADFKIK